jgi:trimeric autotransporter adhesin
MRCDKQRAFPARKIVAVAMVTALAWVVGLTPARAQTETTITVDTTSDVADFGGGQTVADLPGPDGQTSFREATIASTNTDGPETIAFDIPTTDPGFDGTRFTIATAAAAPPLTIGDDATTVDATTQPGGFSITLDGPGSDPAGEFNRGLVVTSSGNSIIGLAVRDYVNAIEVRGGSDNLLTAVTVTGNFNGVSLAGSEVGTGNAVTDSTVSDNGLGFAVTFSTDVVLDGNTIAGNDRRGVFANDVDELTITDNVIDGNTFFGIEHLGGTGGTATGNTITGNGLAGIVVTGGVFTEGFKISRNVISANDGLGIDLLGGREDANGVTRNDAQDRDDGGNDLMNYPDRLMATDDGAATVVKGRIDFPDPQSVTIELFANTAPDPSGFGEGETFLGTATPDAKGRFTATLPAGLAGQWITATATDSAGNTSEFSEAVLVGTPKK